MENVSRNLLYPGTYGDTCHVNLEEAMSFDVQIIIYSQRKEKPSNDGF